MYYKKKYSQIFLVNEKKNNDIANQILLLEKKIKYKYLLEIGPGLGNITNKLVNLINKRYYLVEIDKRFVKILKKRFIKKNLKIINNSILNIKLKSRRKFFIIGNFPYNISSKIILWIIFNRKKIIRCLGLFQKEFISNLFYNKLKYNSKLSLQFNMFFKIKKIFLVEKNNFFPKPKVDSMYVDIKPRNIKYSINFFKFHKLINEIYKFKRKILKNSFKKIYKKKIDYKKKFFYKRPEDLTIKEFIKLYKIYYNYR